MIKKPQALPVQTGNIPADLQAIPRWVCWKYVERTKPDGGKVWAKLPMTTGGRAASSTNPATWTSYGDAEEAYLLGDFDGIGLVLGADLQGIDLDDCRDPETGDLSELAQELLEKVDGYAEVSPSATGIKLFTRSNLDGSRTKKELGVEMYREGRYFTVTGHQLNGHEALPADVQDVGWLVRKVFDQDLSSPVLQGDASDLALALYKPPLEDWTIDRIRAEIGPHLDLEMHYEDWIKVGQALYHQFEGSEEGFELWDEMFQGSSKYAGPEYGWERWRSFKTQRPSGRGPVTLASLLAKTKVQRETAKAAAKLGTFQVLSADELGQLKPLDWAVRGLLPATGLAIIYGPSASGKSFLAIDLAAAVAAGNPAWFGFRVYARPVTLVALEGSAGLPKRIHAWSKHQDREIPGQLRFVVQALDIRELGVVEALAAAICSAGGAGGLVVVDTLAQASPGLDENSGKDMSEIISAAGRLQHLVGGLVLLVAHSGKDESRGLRGHSSLFAAADAVIEVNRKNGQRSWRVAKAKDDVDGSTFGFELATIELGVDEDLEKVTSCVIVPTGKPLQRRKTLTQGQQLAISTLQQAIDAQPRANSTGMPGAHLDDWRRAYYRQSAADKGDAKRRAFNRARSNLVEAGLVQVEDDVYSLVPGAENFFK